MSSSMAKGVIGVVVVAVVGVAGWLYMGRTHGASGQLHAMVGKHLGGTPRVGKVAVVNVQDILRASPKVADINKQLQTEFKPRQEKIQDMQAKLRGDLDKLRGMKEDNNERADLKESVTAEEKTLTENAMKYQENFTKARATAMQKILAQLDGVIGQVTRKHNYVLVVNSSVVAFAAKDLNITKQVSEAFNKI